VFCLHASFPGSGAEIYLASLVSKGVRRFSQRDYYPFRRFIRMDGTVESPERGLGFPHGSGLEHLQRNDWGSRVLGPEAR
jgi:hypothetical protein